jgi:DNA-binding NarL/FixJ family response regulator
VSDRLAARGTSLFADEAAYAAAMASRAAGDGRGGARAASRAAELHAACENAAIPWVAGFQSGELLTRREQQVALLAAELEISVRTVQNHLARVYRKLGISRRGDPADALG